MLYIDASQLILCVFTEESSAGNRLLAHIFISVNVETIGLPEIHNRWSGAQLHFTQMPISKFFNFFI